jgi:dual specificity MAP kinase phosphatase
MEVKSVGADAIFRLFTACPDDPKVYVLDVRPNKQFLKRHVIASYSIRLAANGTTLLVSPPLAPLLLTVKAISAHA